MALDNAQPLYLGNDLTCFKSRQIPVLQSLCWHHHLVADLLKEGRLAATWRAGQEVEEAGQRARPGQEYPPQRIRFCLPLNELPRPLHPAQTRPLNQVVVRLQVLSAQGACKHAYT